MPRPIEDDEELPGWPRNLLQLTQLMPEVDSGLSRDMLSLVFFSDEDLSNLNIPIHKDRVVAIVE